MAHDVPGHASARKRYQHHVHDANTTLLQHKAWALWFSRRKIFRSAQQRQSHPANVETIFLRPTNPSAVRQSAAARQHCLSNPIRRSTSLETVGERTPGALSSITSVGSSTESARRRQSTSTRISRRRNTNHTKPTHTAQPTGGDIPLQAHTTSALRSWLVTKPTNDGHGARS